MSRAAAQVLAAWLALSGCRTGTAPTTNALAAVSFGENHQGVYHLGPVEFAGSIPNACAPYTDDVTRAAGPYLIGLANELAEHGGLCDACVLVETDAGKKVLARAVTYGMEHDAGDVDLSPDAFNLIYQNEFPRAMQWHLANCGSTDPIFVQFQTEANEYWTSLWIRNANLPVSTLEVKSKNHADWFALARGTDGTFTDAKGFGGGAFTLRATALTGEAVELKFPSGFTAGAVVKTATNFGK